MQNDVETQHKHTYSLYIGSLCNEAFPMARFTRIVTSQVFVEFSCVLISCICILQVRLIISQYIEKKIISQLSLFFVLVTEIISRVVSRKMITIFLRNGNTHHFRAAVCITLQEFIPIISHQSCHEFGLFDN